MSAADPDPPGMTGLERLTGEERRAVARALWAREREAFRLGILWTVDQCAGVRTVEEADAAIARIRAALGERTGSGR